LKISLDTFDYLSEYEKVLQAEDDKKSLQLLLAIIEMEKIKSHRRSGSESQTIDQVRSKLNEEGGIFSFSSKPIHEWEKKKKKSISSGCSLP